MRVGMEGDLLYTAFFIGNIASGKSTATRYLESRGAYRIDLDAMAKQLYVPGSALVAKLAEAFGPDVLDEQSGVDRAVLAQRAFASDEATEQLNAIVHPALREALIREVFSDQSEPLASSHHGVELTVIEASVPEAVKSLFARADETVAIAVPLDIRRERACVRGMTSSDFDARARRQPTDDALCALATTVISNLGSTDDLIAALDQWLCVRGLLQRVPPLAGTEQLV